MHAAVTFDDAFIGVYENAIPEIVARKIPCTIFVPAQLLGTLPKWWGMKQPPDPWLRVMNEQQLLSLPSDLVSIGSHTMTHPNLKLVDEGTARDEFVRSRERLQELTGHPIPLFAYPYGAHNQQLTRWALESGYDKVLTLAPRLWRNTRGQQVIGRILTTPHDWKWEFRLKLRGAYQWQALVSAAKQMAQNWRRTPRKSSIPRPVRCLAKPDYVIEVDEPDEARWTNIIRQFDDATIYQTWAYEKVRWGERHMSHMVLRRNGGVAAAAQVRVVKTPFLPLGIAYVYWGPLWRVPGHEPNPEAASEMLRALRNEYVERRGLLLRIAPREPAGDAGRDFRQILESQGFRARQNGKPYRTFVVDLAPSMEELRKSLRHTWRTNLNKAERQPFEVRTGTSAEMYSQFIALYGRMHDRKQFLQHVDVTEFQAMQEVLPEHLKMRVMICSLDKEPVVAGVCSVIGDTAIQLFLATTERALEAQGAYRLFWEQIRMLKEQRVRYYDIGGVDPDENPGGYRFKAGLSGAMVSHVGDYEASAVNAWMVQSAEIVRERVARHGRFFSSAAPAATQSKDKDKAS
jgi:peptidoglycan/xylan/chitin deacetylase (PgdA/CDA1 family)/lipid II:glycine glycyltransferase (peptidoglycan interpeptide bridge formation enzyme)